MIQGLTILETDIPNVFSGIDPDTLASAHALWARDVLAYGPWSRESDVGGDRVYWRAARQEGQNVLLIGDCSSTMDAAWRLKDSLSDWSTVLAVTQGQGRGQIRRHWVSPPGNVYASVFWPMPDGRDAGAGWNEALPVAVGYVLVRALEDFGLNVRLKWPNDMLVDGKKAGGILIEERAGRILVGVGLNLSSAPDVSGLRDGSAVAATILPLTGATVLDTWLTLVKRAENEYLKMLESIALPDFLRLVEERLAWMGKHVLVLEGRDVSYKAKIVGLERKGGLVLRSDGRKRILYSGSILPL